MIAVSNPANVISKKNEDSFAKRIPFNIQDWQRPLRLLSLSVSLSALFLGGGRYICRNIALALLNILLSYISCLTEISNISKERTKRRSVGQIFLVSSCRQIFTRAAWILQTAVRQGMPKVRERREKCSYGGMRCRLIAAAFPPKTVTTDVRGLCA